MYGKACASSRGPGVGEPPHPVFGRAEPAPLFELPGKKQRIIIADRMGDLLELGQLRQSFQLGKAILAIPNNMPEKIDCGGAHQRVDRAGNEAVADGSVSGQAA